MQFLRQPVEELMKCNELRSLDIPMSLLDLAVEVDVSASCWFNSETISVRTSRIISFLVANIFVRSVAFVITLLLVNVVK